jgi:hypothetical protein
MRTSTTNAIVLVLLIALLFGALWPAFQSPGPPEDEGIALVYPEMFMKGRLPYRDFETIYGPGNLLVLCGTYRLFGDNIFVERTVGLIYRLLILLAMMAIAHRFGIVLAFAAGLVVAIIFAGTDLFANTWWAATAFALMSMLLAEKRESRWLCSGAGVLFALAVLCRCDIAPVAIIGFLPLTLAMQRKSLVAFLIGALVGFLPLAWFAAVIGPGQLVHALFIFPVFELSSSAYLPLSSAPIELRWIFYLSIFAGVINLIASFMALRHGRPEGGRLFLAAAIFGAGSIYYALSRFDGTHVINATLVSIGLLPVSLQILISKKFHVQYASLAAAVIALAAVHAVYFHYARYFYRNLRVAIHLDQPREAKWGEPLEPGDKGFFIRNGDRCFPLGRTAVADLAQRLVTELVRISAPGQKLLVGPGDLRRTVGADTFFYHLLPALEPATYYLEMNPGSTNATDSRLASDVAGTAWLILDRSWDYINEPNRSSEFGSDVPNQIVREKFDLWAEYGPYLLMRSQRLRNSLQLPPGQQ